MKNKAARCRYYFVDEAGDTTIFGQHGKVLITTRYGVYYTQKKPLTLAALEKDLPGI